MSSKYEILPATVQLLERPVSGQVRFSDVYAETVAAGQDLWWRQTDYDANLTDEVESSGFPKCQQIPIGLRPWFANYGVILVDDLVRAQTDRAHASQALDADTLHPDRLKELHESRGAVLALANYAPRDDANTAKGANGSDFYLAITDAGLEIYVTPLNSLSGLEARHRIVSLYRIPTQGHPEFNGDYEQFRSARVVRTRRHPSHLVPVFEYQDRKSVIEAKHDGTHPQDIPVDPRPGHIGHIDKFGNVRAELAAINQFQGLQVGKFATLVVTNRGKTYELAVTVAENLHTAPLGKLAVYANCSDYADVESERGFIELVARVNGNPSTSSETAIFQVQSQIPDLDPATASLLLAA